MAAIFITAETITLADENYGGIFNDMLAICPHTGDVHILCRGQWTGRCDNIIIENEEIHIFSRRNTRNEFTYWGIAQKEWTINRKIPVGVKTSNIEDLSLFKLKIKSENIINEVIPRNRMYNGSGCLKKSCLNHIGVTVLNGSMMNCFIRL